MKIKLKRRFKYTFDNITVHEILPGEYEVPRQVDKDAAHLALGMGAAVIIPAQKKAPTKPKLTKKAPENKMIKAKESK